MEMYYIITCDAGVREKIRVSAMKYENPEDAMRDAVDAAKRYIAAATVCELSNNEDANRELYVKRVIAEDGVPFWVRKIGSVRLY